MSPAAVIAIALGGCLGALLRAFIGRLIQTRFPSATLIVNVAGSFIITLFLVRDPDPAGLVNAFVATGFCGALTTFSTFILEAVLLYRTGFRHMAVLYIGTTLFLCCLASWIAFISVR